ncbi:hypothetical protein GMD78_12150 [Ornithinibacillus sp. L9]|uniref:Uncharacterized protein n=1 Tax=Ornithinibacillus caprae TaxID=2678566 RepID=A0A6N8FK89_9BACI|nr:hypothetical protein [Ornithinibacillus caprae]MUK89126.1 hypothetical protein [Ornithinibacillus caprae]
MPNYRIVEVTETENVYYVIGKDAQEAMQNLRKMGPQVFKESFSKESHTTVNEVNTDIIVEEEPTNE